MSSLTMVSPYLIRIIRPNPRFKPFPTLPSQPRLAQIEIVSAEEPRALDAARLLIREHFAAHSEAHGPAERDAVIAALPHPYTPPRGGLWVAFDDGVAAGSAALHELDATTAEVKRMYVDPRHRGKGIARVLLRHVLAEAHGMNYRALRLGTLTTMHAARSLYASEGFVSIPAYRSIEFGDTAFYELALGDGSSAS